MPKDTTYKRGGIFRIPFEQEQQDLFSDRHAEGRETKAHNLPIVEEGEDFPSYEGGVVSVFATVGKTLLRSLEAGEDFLSVDVVRSDPSFTKDEIKYKVRMLFKADDSAR